MSDRSMWKLLHLLYTLKPGQNGLTDRALLDVGIDCGPDTVNPLLDARAVTYEGGGQWCRHKDQHQLPR